MIKNVRQLFFGILSALASAMLVLAAASLTLVEAGGVDALRVTAPAWTATAPLMRTPDAQATSANTVQATLAVQPSPTACPQPANWQVYTVQPGDDLSVLAQNAGVSLESVLRANCMISAALMPNTTLFLPSVGPTYTPLAPTMPSLPTAAPSDTPFPCRPRAGWVPYIVQPGDNLYRLSQIFGISQQTLQAGNCMFGSVTIYVGRKIYVPNLPTPTPTRAPVLEKTPVPPTQTQIVPTPTPEMATATAVLPSPTGTNTVTPTATVSPTATATLETATAAAIQPTIQESTSTP